MRKIKSKDIIDKVIDLCGEVNFNLPHDIVDCITSYIKNDNSISDNILNEILENAKIARQKKIALCQDTGTANFFVKIVTLLIWCNILKVFICLTIIFINLGIKKFINGR